MSGKKVAIVDVDSILYDFIKPCLMKMQERHPSCFFPKMFEYWDQPFNVGFTGKEVLDIFNEIHVEQDQHGTIPGAKQLLDYLTYIGYHVKVATNRPSYHLEKLLNWMGNNDLFCDSIFCNDDKTLLFDDENVVLLIDDRPSTQKEARDLEIEVLTIEYNYNQDVHGVHKFYDLFEMIEYLKID